MRPLLEKFKTMNKLSASLQEFEDLMAKSMGNKELGEVMKDYHTFVDSGRREFYRIEA